MALNLNNPTPNSIVAGLAALPSVKVIPSRVTQSAPTILKMPSGVALAGVAVPVPALSVTDPEAIIVTVLVELNTGLSVALPTVKPVAGAVSLPAARVNVTGPDIAETAFKSVKAAAKDVYDADKFGVVLVGLVTVTPTCA